MRTSQLRLTHATILHEAPVNQKEKRSTTSRMVLAALALYAALLPSMGSAFPISVSRLPFSRRACARYGIVPAPVWDAAIDIQIVGESALAATFVIAFLQASIALIQYRSNPAGELIIPPGPTFGTELPRCTTRKIASDDKLEKHASLSAPMASDDGANTTTCATSTTTSRYVRILSRLNRSLLLLMPLAYQAASALFERQWHLLHIGVILTLARILDVPNAFLLDGEKQKSQICVSQDGCSTSMERILVLGDSLAIGLGTVNVFNTDKNQTLDYRLVENLSAPRAFASPVFPQVLAQQLAERQNRQVRWRSAGVDGGTVAHVQTFCLDVLRQEMACGHPPDLVVLLCGINDLKQFVSNPFESVSPKDFRRRLSRLVSETRRICPNTKVAIPALPTQMFHFSSPLNIFPLALFLDFVCGIWESQKKAVVENISSKDVIYVDLLPSEIHSWYKDKSWLKEEDDSSECRSGSLIAADGVHPSARCYEKWAEYVARSLCSQLVEVLEVASM
jgi:lysophospholipase L1-like esterase